MKLAFYKVKNSKNYGRHTFDEITDKPEKVVEMLAELGDEELRIYNFDNIFDVWDLREDFNDEEINGNCWWCVTIND